MLRRWGISFIFVLPIFAGCSEQSSGGANKSELSGISKQDVAIYFDAKGIAENDSKRAQRQLDFLIEQTAQADVIRSKEWQGKRAAELKALEKANEILISEYLDTLATAEVTDEEVNQYFESHPEQYSVRSGRIAHLMLRKRPSDSSKEIQVKLEHLNRIRKEIIDGLSFDDAVASYSEDLITKEKNGDLGVVTEDSPQGMLLESVFDLEVGVVSEVVESDRGLHLVSLTEPVEITHKELESVSENIRYRLSYERKSAGKNNIKDKAENAVSEAKARLKE